MIWHRSGTPEESRKKTAARYRERKRHEIRERQNELNFRWRMREVAKDAKLENQDSAFLDLYKGTQFQMENQRFTFLYQGHKSFDSLET
jgi:hypothetical protein